MGPPLSVHAQGLGSPQSPVATPASPSSPHAATGSAPFTADDCPPIADDALFFGPSRGEYRLSQTSFLSVHMALLAVVSSVQILWGEVGTVAAAAGQAVCVIAVLLLTLGLLWLHDPHKRDEGLQPYVDYYALWLAVLQAMLNAVAAAVAISQRQGTGEVPSSLQTAYTGVAYLATVAALGLLCLVVVAFVEALWRRGGEGDVAARRTQSASLSGWRKGGGEGEGDGDGGNG